VRTKYVFHVTASAVTEFSEVIRAYKDDQDRVIEETVPLGWKIKLGGGTVLIFGDKEKPDIRSGELLEITITGKGP
jgi:hypothetical protein